VEYLKQAPWNVKERSDEVTRTVSEMLLAIDRDGEAAIRRYSRELDDWDPPSFVVARDEIRVASHGLSPALLEHIAFAQAQVRRFAEAQLETLRELDVETLPGVTLGHRHIPVNRVGSYVPGGRYPMLASAFMTVIVPKVAGVGTVVACAPPRGNGIHPPMLHAMATSGADVILCLGGVQALAALAYGIEGLAGNDMVVGAGNAYVAEAKRQLFGTVGIDVLAGPTEVLVIADDTADPRLVAVDLLGQAEHGPTSPAGLVTTSRALGTQVMEVIEELAEAWPSGPVAGAAWRDHGMVVVVESHDEAMAVADSVAPEHLEVQVADDMLDSYLAGLTNYGSLFLDREATVAYGDKAVGTNHVLPTMGAARYSGGLWVGKFLKTCTYQRLTRDGTRRIAPAVAAISHAERFSGHALTAELRLEDADEVYAG
jgi:sulfopropanediol 3-dehydrogenase